MTVQETPSLYDRLGGVYNIATVIDDLIDRVMADDRLNANPRVDEAHHRVSPAGFKYYVTEMACGAAGGPQQYSGRSMGDSHRHLEITEEEWGAFMDDLQQTMNKFDVPPPEQAKLTAIIESTHDGIVTSDEARFGDLPPRPLGRPVTLAIAAPPEPSLEEYWPDIAELDYQETVTDEAMPAGTFFDLATIHVLTTATLNRLRELYPQGRFEVRRFRPNIVVRPENGDAEFVERKWVRRELRIGDHVVLEITDHCPRCVMTTLPQRDLPKDSGILRTAARHNDVHVGIYGQVRRGGRVQRGDTGTLG